MYVTVERLNIKLIKNKPELQNKSRDPGLYRSPRGYDRMRMRSQLTICLLLVIVAYSSSHVKHNSVAVSAVLRVRLWILRFLVPIQKYTYLLLSKFQATV